MPPLPSRPSITLRRPALRGYTLIEVLATVTILGIAAAVVVPRMGSRADLEVSAASRQLLSDLDLARSEAITQNMPIYISFTTATAPGGTYKVCKSLPSGYLINPVTKNAWVTQFGAGSWKGIQIQSANFDGKTILMFDETGAPFSCTSTGTATSLSSGAILLNCREKSLTVRIEPLTGAMTVQ